MSYNICVKINYFIAPLSNLSHAETVLMVRSQKKILLELRAQLIATDTRAPQTHKCKLARSKKLLLFVTLRAPVNQQQQQQKNGSENENNNNMPARHTRRTLIPISNLTIRANNTKKLHDENDFDL